MVPNPHNLPFPRYQKITMQENMRGCVHVSISLNAHLILQETLHFYNE